MCALEAIESGGGVKCWGHNGNGQLGVSTVEVLQFSPVAVPGVNPPPPTCLPVLALKRVVWCYMRDCHI